jgi:hypothetical protein
MTEEQKKQRGGTGRGQGRKPLAVGEKPVTVGTVLTRKQAARFKAIGGAKWLRGKLDESEQAE